MKRAMHDVQHSQSFRVTGGLTLAYVQVSMGLAHGKQMAKLIFATIRTRR